MDRLTKLKAMKKMIIGLALALCAMISLSSCAVFSNWGENFARDWRGTTGVLKTYDEDGNTISSVKGNNLKIERNSDFDSSNSEGGSNKDSSVLSITVGNSHMHHVGSTMVLADEQLVDISAEVDTKFELESVDRSVPWLNEMKHRYSNLWQGKSQTVVIRSQSGKPVAVYAGNNVEVFATDIPKSTQLRVDGNHLLVYRADYTIYDDELLP